MVRDKRTKCGLIAFANDGGLGAQTRRLAAMLKPDRIMVIDSSNFSRNKEQHFEWYKDYNFFVVNGFPNNADIRAFLPNLTHVLVCENPYNFGLIYWAQQQGTKVYVQSNYEFNDNLAQPWLPIPDKFLMPSHWMIPEMVEKFGEEKVMYLPPPIDPLELQKARAVNLKRKGKKRFLHVIGTAASHDRNGTFDVLDSVKLTKGDYELVIRSQQNLSMDVFLDDPRVKYEVGNIKDTVDLYTDFDALLLPRRWGGLCLTMVEALVSGLPVLMSDITPNKELLPDDWLCPANRQGTFQARTPIPYYSVGHGIYSAMIDTFAQMSDEVMLLQKEKAYKTGVLHFSEKNLRSLYLNLFNDRKS